MFYAGNADTHDSLTIEVVDAESVDKHVVRQVGNGNRAQDAEGVDKLLSSAGLAVGGYATQAGVDVGDDIGIKQIPELNRTQKFRQ